MIGIYTKILRNLINQTEFRREEIKSILIIRMNRVGDMINTIPLIKTLRGTFH
jgi:hypothetical protein